MPPYGSIQAAPVTREPATPTATMAGSAGSMKAVAASDPARTTAPVSHQDGRPDAVLGGRSSAAVSPAAAARGALRRQEIYPILPLPEFIITAPPFIFRSVL